MIRLFYSLQCLLPLLKLVKFRKGLIYICVTSLQMPKEESLKVNPSAISDQSAKHHNHEGFLNRVSIVF